MKWNALRWNKFKRNEAKRKEMKWTEMKKRNQTKRRLGVVMLMTDLELDDLGGAVHAVLPVPAVAP
eukprot:scaffold29360_cov33-Prasinocladus_malaysianus.AAC.2